MNDDPMEQYKPMPLHENLWLILGGSGSFSDFRK